MSFIQVDRNTIDKRIREFALHAPEKIAIECADNKRTYKELEENSNRICHFLMDQYKESKNVFVFMNKGIALIETLIGVMKSGGIFVPIDPSASEDRIALMLGEVEADWVITTSDLLDKWNGSRLKAQTCQNVMVQDVNDSNEIQDVFDLPLFFIGNDTAISREIHSYSDNKHCYIYFTSGSTGKPKCILGRHESLLHFIEWEIREMGVDTSSRVSQLTPISFDPFLRDVFVPLCAGGTLCIPMNQDIILHPTRLINWLEDKQVTLVHTVPSLFKVISNHLESSDALPNLTHILLAGELLRGNDVKRFMDVIGTRVQIVNLYGPTETTLAKVFYKVSEEDGNKAIIPVGKPISNTQVYILNEDAQKCGKGIVGDIYIRTPFISSGYINDRELTHQVFMKNPFTDNPNDIIYRTGDLGRRLIDDNIEVIGRADNQVKIRGMRIELSEIENKLLKHHEIKEAVVIAKADESHTKYLCAFIISDEQVDTSVLRQYLANELPDNMVPSYFLQIDRIPLNQNGKTDRKKLESLEIMTTEVEYVPPTNEMEQKVADMWVDIFKVEKISIDSNFFDIGGHSLRAAKLMAEIYKECHVEISLAELFEKTTIRAQADYIVKAQKSTYEKIPQIEEKDYYEASSAQKRMYMLQQFDSESTAYHLPNIRMIEGKVDRNRLEKAFRELIQRHETLRTSFESKEEKILQRVNQEVEFSIEYMEKREAEVEEIVREFIRPFDLGKAPLLRVALVRLADDKHVLLSDMHHIISDATSIGRMMYEFATLYEQRDVDELRIQYKDYTEWQYQLLASDEMKVQEEYWMNRFSDEIPVLDLPTDYPRPNIKSFEGDYISFTVDKEITRNLREVAQQTRSTMYMVLLSAITILLAKYSRQEDITVGSPIAGRTHADLDNMIGMFVNTLAMRNQPVGSKVYEDFLQEVKENALAAYAHQDYQFEELVDKLHVQRDLGRNPIFDVMFTLQNADVESFSFEELTFTEYKQESKVAKFDVAFSANEGNEEIAFLVEYSSKLFKKETMERMITQFLQIISAIGTNVTCKICEIEVLSQEEKNDLLYAFNDTYVDYPRDKTLQELWTEQVKKTPHKVAVMYGEQQVTYKELDEKSNQIAHALREKGITNEGLVAIYFERSIDMLASIIGIMKAGGAYIPIDVNFPVSRMKTMLSDSRATFIMTKSPYVNRMEFYTELASNTAIEHIIYLDSIEDANADHEIFRTIKLAEYLSKTGESQLNEHYIVGASVCDVDYVASCSTEDVENRSNPTNLSYIIYTSGSSGKPKGAMVEHQGMVNHLYAKINDLNLSAASIIAQNASHCFDISVWQFFAALMCGGTTIIYSNETVMNPEELVNRVIQDKVTILEVVPSFLHAMLNHLAESEKAFTDLEFLLVTGEELKPKLVKRWFDMYQGIKLVNAYGPTEASDDITHYVMSEFPHIGKIPIGKTVQNLAIYIVDDYLKLCPMGVKGEIVVSGIGVGRGYINDEEKTKKAFTINPYSREENERLYKTGDLGKWLPDGTIEYLGRLDYQVKIRGHRIELGEIESIINQQDAVKEAVVLVHGDDIERQYLCAYMVVQDVDIQVIKNSLKDKLPEYMMPASYVLLEKMPLTSNGKVDRQALLNMEGTREDSKKIPPRNFYDNTIVQIWKDVLKLEEIYIQDDFFEIGGSSINMIQVANRIKQELGAEVTFADLMVYKTVLELSEYIAQKENNGSQFKNVFKMNKGTSDKNIFIVHGAGGDIFLYRDLAKLLEDEYNVYGIQPKGLNGEEPFSSSYYEMMHDYINEIRTIQSEGPYIIAGYCTGGIVSYDLVNILELQGDKVTALLELDHEAYIRKGMYRSFVHVNSMIIGAIEAWRKISKKDKAYTLEKYSKWMRKAKPISKERQLSLLQNVEDLRNYFGRELVVKSNYVSLGFISSPTLVIKGEDNHHHLLKEELWRKMVKGPLEFYEVPGDHDSVLYHPHVDKVAEIIKAYLKKRSNN
ncbi:amino acid adenylation domain-containing protein [Brevibacillus laterosporus]|uniref:Amino acid adenylation domain-containing protein n=1 Tax=Brevibacillus laterosporus TaxID=1465 RepID=A0A518V5I0_BRELA|nr:amino acid adenylation domain-containing protein [Brevibacillus laterosporus]